MLDKANGIPGSVWHNSDDSYTIFIDASLSAEKQKEVFEHELRHIENGDFDLECGNVQDIETVTHSLVVPSEAPAMSVECSKAEKQKKQQASLKRRKILKRLRKYQEDMEFLENMGAGLDTFARGEYYKLYGNDL